MQAYGLHFSLSHAGTMVTVAVSRIAEVGVDIETLDHNINLHDLTFSILTPAEQDIMFALAR